MLKSLYISNCSMLPFGWTVETLISTHVSKPYNPDIAKVFYRAGYIESWGRGIQKIRDACKNLGADDPEYIVHGEDIMVKFSALQGAKVLDTKALNVTKDVTKDVAIEMVRKAVCEKIGKFTKSEIMELVPFLSKASVENSLTQLMKDGVVDRHGKGKATFYTRADV